jgi:hypothetical protein
VGFRVHADSFEEKMLLSLAQYKLQRGINSTTDDAKLNTILASISALVKNYCGRSFIDYYSVNKVEKFSLKWEQKAVFLSETPIVNVVTVKELDEGTNNTYTTLTSSQFVVDNNMDAIYRVENGEFEYFPTGINAVEVTYTGGYATTPEDLKLALVDLTTYYYKDEYKPELNHSSFTIRNPTSAADFPEHIKRVLDLYRSV